MFNVDYQSEIDGIPIPVPEDASLAIAHKSVGFPANLVPPPWRKKLKQRAKKSTLLTELYLRFMLKQSHKKVATYVALHRKPDLVVFCYVFDMMAYLKLTTPPLPKIVLFHHSDGIRWVMMEQNFPKVRKCPSFTRIDKALDQCIHTADANAFIAYIGRENFHKENPSVPVNSLKCFHNGVDNIPLDPTIQVQQNPPYKLITTGTVDQRKGQHLVIEAIASLPPSQRTKFSYTIVGDGPGMPVCEQLVKEHHLEEIVHFLGRVPNTEVHGLLQQASIYILMSNNEGLPISIIEAMRAQLPIISTHVAGIPELVAPMQNGILLPPSAQELSMIFSEIEQYNWQAMGAHSRQRFEKEFTIEQMITNFAHMVKEVINE